MIARTPNLHPALRFVATGCVALWLLATSYCSVEHLFGLDHHHEDSNVHASGDAHQSVADNDAAEHSYHESDADAEHHSHDAEGNNHGSHHHDGKDRCCSTIQATVLSSNPMPLGKPALTQIAFLCVPVEANNFLSLPQNDSSFRHSKTHDWAFTPEVCTGPANRSHAPPASV